MGVELPDFLFTEKFEHYGFFDMDITSDRGFLPMLQDVIHDRLGFDGLVHVFSSKKREYFGSSKMGKCWAENMVAVGQLRRENDDYSGLTLIASDGSWAIHQEYPVTYGVFGYNGGKRLLQFGPQVKDYFFDLADLTRWCTGKTKRDIRMRRDYGTDLFGALLINYGG